jgi:serine protease Do
MEDLINLGHVVRPVMGVIIQNLDPVMAKAFGLESPQGVLIEDFIPKKNSPAELGGLERGDVIVSVESRPVNFSQQLQEMIAKRRPGETVAVTVIRKGQKFTRRVTLGSKEIGEQKPSSKGKAIQPGKTFIGMGLREITNEDLDELALENKTGLIVDRLDSGGIAERSGLMLGDVLLKINYHPVASLEEANDLLDDVSPGTALLFQILRGGTNRFISLEVP